MKSSAAPTAPLITDLTIPAREGVEYQLNCSSSNGNPAPKITWYKNDAPLEGVHGGKLIASGNPFEWPTVNVLTIIPRMEDHLAIYKCRVSGKALEMYSQKQPNYQFGYEINQKLLVECK